MAERFVEVTDEELLMFVEEQENKNTRRKTDYVVQLFVKFLEKERPDLNCSFHELTANELNSLLSKFIFAVRKKDGSNYEPSSLRGILGSIQRHLSHQNYGYTIFKDPQFEGVMAILKAKQKELKSKGLGNKPQATNQITDEEIELLYQAKALGTHSPQALINTMWIQTTLHFGLRGGKEQRDLCWGNIQLIQASNGSEYLEYSTERQTKTRSGSNPRDTRKIKPRMYSNPNLSADRDPVRVYKTYRSKRPESMNLPDSPFYLATNIHSNLYDSRPWFKAQPLGVNKLNSIAKDMAKQANLDLTNKRITNHSARKHLVQKLNDNNIPANQIMQITGHKNINSVNNYSSLSDGQMQQISNILSFSETENSTELVPHSSSSACCEKLQEYHCSSTSTTKEQFNPNIGSLFSGAVTGGTFHIDVKFQQPVSPHARETETRKFKRIRIESSSESSQE